MLEDLVIREARHADVDALADLKLATFRATFIEGFKIPYPPVDLALFEEDSYAPVHVAEDIADASKQHWVADAGGELIGYAQCGPCKMPHPEIHAGSGELYQVYVNSSAHGLGLGSKLLDTAFRWLRIRHPGPQWLGVWSGNLKAQAIYQARGFTKVGDYEFPVGDWRDHEFIYRRD